MWLLNTRSIKLFLTNHILRSSGYRKTRWLFSVQDLIIPTIYTILLCYKNWYHIILYTILCTSLQTKTIVWRIIRRVRLFKNLLSVRSERTQRFLARKKPSAMRTGCALCGSVTTTGCGESRYAVVWRTQRTLKFRSKKRFAYYYNNTLNWRERQSRNQHV